jgi:hypothetical protein
MRGNHGRNLGISHHWRHELVLCKKCGTGFDRPVRFTVFPRVLCERCEGNRKYQRNKERCHDQL